MIIKIRTFAMLREVIGEKSIEFTLKNPNLTIIEIINLLIDQFPPLDSYIMSENKLNRNYVFAVNGERINHDKIYEKQLSENDELAILPPAGGG